MASSLFPSSKLDGASNDRVITKVADVPSWESVRLELEQKLTTEEKAFRENVERGIGRASPLNKVRLYEEGVKEEDVRVVFYRDSASWCPYCQKVWLCLEEKRIPYRIEKINMSCYGSKPNSFIRLNPSGTIPVAKIDGKIYNQSNEIIFALEREFPTHKALIPNDGGGDTFQALMRLERNLFSAWLFWLTSNAGDRAKAGFKDVLQQVEAELASSPNGDFFLGADVSVIDMLFAPFLERLVASLLFFKGFTIRVVPGTNTPYPAINRWFDAMEGLESYQLTKGDYYSHCWDLPPQLGGCTYEEGGEPFEKAINGELRLGSRSGNQGGSWEYPLEAHNGGVEPDWGWCGDAAAARREAVERLTYNHHALVKFATRGAGRKGMPPYSAVLSDPNAVGEDAVQGGVDACLRLVSLALLNDGVGEEEENSMEKVAQAVVDEGGVDYADGVVKSLVYLRDRVGVPRDMRLPAARELRARLNWAIGKILKRIEP